MAKPVILPRQGQSVESCIISKWFKKKGDPVIAGELLFSYETDKAGFDEEASESGIILELFFEEGEDVPCLTTVCVIGEEGEDASVYNPLRDSKGKPDAGQAAAKSSVEVPTDIESGDEGSYDRGADRIKVSPRAKRLSQDALTDYRQARRTGPGGRIVERDILRLKESGPAFTSAAHDIRAVGDMTDLPRGTGLGGRITADDLARAEFFKAGHKEASYEGNALRPEDTAVEEVKLTHVRRVIAKTMQASLANTAQLTLNTSFDATEILNLRSRFKSRGNTEFEAVTLNDMILFAVSRTLTRHAALNAHLAENRLLLFKHVNLGVAVDTERGLMVPTLFQADKKTLPDISNEVKKLAGECQAGSVNPDLLKNGSFTVTSLGALGIESFTPVINPPQTGILGVNNIIRRARDRNGKIEYYPAMGLSLTFDHRALDGAPAARFLRDLAEHLENFTSIFDGGNLECTT